MAGRVVVEGRPDVPHGGLAKRSSKAWVVIAGAPVVVSVLAVDDVVELVVEAAAGAVEAVATGTLLRLIHQKAAAAASTIQSLFYTV